MPKKLDMALLEKLAASGKIKKETLQSVKNYNDGGMVERQPAQDEGFFKKLTNKLGLPGLPTKEELAAKMTPEEKLMYESPMLAEQTLPKTGLVERIGEGLQALGEAGRERKAQLLQDVGMVEKGQPQEPTFEGFDPSTSGAATQNVSSQGDFSMPQGSRAMDLMEAGFMQEMSANQQEAAATAQGLAKTQQILAKQQDIENKLNMERQMKLDEQQKKVDMATAEYMQGKVDPDRFWANKSTGQRIGMAVSLFLSGINGSQAGAQILNNAIDRDLDAQKADLAKLKSNVDISRNLLGDMMDRFGDERQAMAAAKLTQIQMAELQVKQQLAKAQGTKAYGEMLQGLGKLETMKMEAAKKFQMASMLNPQVQQSIEFDRAYFSLPEEYQKKAVKLPGNKLGIAISDESAKKVREKLPSIDSLQNILNSIDRESGLALPLTEKRGRLESLRSQALLAIKGMEGTGVLDAQTERIVDDGLGKSWSINQPKFKAALKSMQDKVEFDKKKFLESNLVNYKPLTLQRVK